MDCLSLLFVSNDPALLEGFLLAGGSGGLATAV